MGSRHRKERAVRHAPRPAIGVPATAVIAAAFVVTMATEATTFAQGSRAAASSSAKPYVVPHTPWGDPDLQGVFTNSDESQTPMERPA
jgi:hypothetical protein